MTNYTIDAVLFEREHGCWVGQYLQYDIGAQAENLEQLSYELQKAIAGHVVICADNNVEPFSGLSFGGCAAIRPGCQLSSRPAPSPPAAG